MVAIQEEVIPPCCSHTSSVLGEGWQTTLLNIAKIATLILTPFLTLTGPSAGRFAVGLPFALWAQDLWQDLPLKRTRDNNPWKRARDNNRQGATQQDAALWGAHTFQGRMWRPAIKTRAWSVPTPLRFGPYKCATRG
jgi:hypothetical protein